MKRKNFLAQGILIGAGLVGGCTVAHAEIELGVDAGFRTDELIWSIPGEFVGRDNNYYRQNIVSELTWKNVKSDYLSGYGVFRDRQFVVRGDIGYGRIKSGDNQDSDYRGNNRTQEFSRSINKSNGDHVSDVKISFGLDFGLMPDEVRGPRLQLTPRVGISSHVQSLRMTNLRQTVSQPQYAPMGVTPPAVGSYGGLNSSYEARWSGPWFGGDARYHVNDKISLRAEFEYHQAAYSAEANWNLRSDLAHPKSFAHSADGDGQVWRLGAEMALINQARISFSITSQEWTTGKGTDRFYFADGTSALGILNAVKWRSQAYLLGFQMPFNPPH